MPGVDRIAGLPATAAGFDVIEERVGLLPGKEHAVPTRSTATATDAAVIVCDKYPLSGAGFPDASWRTTTPSSRVRVFRAFVKSMGSCLIVGSAYCKNTNAKVERANGVDGDKSRAYANGLKGLGQASHASP